MVFFIVACLFVMIGCLYFASSVSHVVNQIAATCSVRPAAIIKDETSSPRSGNDPVRACPADQPDTQSTGQPNNVSTIDLQNNKSHEQQSSRPQLNGPASIGLSPVLTRQLASELSSSLRQEAVLIAQRAQGLSFSDDDVADTDDDDDNSLVSSGHAYTGSIYQSDYPSNNQPIRITSSDIPVLAPMTSSPVASDETESLHSLRPPARADSIDFSAEQSNSETSDIKLSSQHDTTDEQRLSPPALMSTTSEMETAVRSAAMRLREQEDSDEEVEEPLDFKSDSDSLLQDLYPPSKVTVRASAGPVTDSAAAKTPSKRGRPRVNPIPLTDPVPKKRGRPRVNPAADPNAPKRGRGRPRKIARPESVGATTQSIA